MSRSLLLLGMLALGTPLLPAGARAADGTAEDFFETSIRPLLVEKCQSCHRPGSSKARLDLTSRATILHGGDSGPAAIPGKPDESLIVDVIRYDGEPRMPPKGKLSEPEIAALTRWVVMGMPWPDAPTGSAAAPTRRGIPIAEARAGHWAFRPIRQPALPEVGGGDWPTSPIDRFILARLEAEGLSPSPQADKRTLIRRLSFNLTGLPPEPSEVEAFAADTSPDAYDRLVDRLLASPQYGEHWARHWLDVARYSDTKGYVYAREESSWVHAWAYRDWVVRALNEDLPYDRFLLFQIAADQASEDPADLAAMGYLTLGRRFLGVTHDIIDDRIDVVTRGTLGLTVACARCHDHKYDPIPTSDYYGLYGVFRSCEERLVPAASEADRARAGDAFEAGLRERRARLDERMSSERAAAAGRVRRRVTDYLLAQLEPDKYPEEDFSQILGEDDLIPTFVRRWRDALALAGERGSPVFRAWHAFARLPKEEFADQAGELNRALAWGELGEVNARVARAFASPPADMREVAEHYGALFGEVIRRWEELLAEARKDGKPAPEGLPEAEAEALRRIVYGPDSPCEVPDEPIVNVESFFPIGACEAIWKLQGEVDRWLLRSSEAPPYAVVLADRATPSRPRVFRRGNPATLGEEVPRRFLQVLSDPEPTPFQQGSGRLELAQAIIDRDNPLTARVLVNRVWMHHFGAGLVRTPGDFGTRAEPPSHPELLDWLASRFVAEGWSLKWLHRTILRSSTYRQSVAGPSDPALAERARRLDPENRWLWRMPVHRLSFEELRDATLAATGELDRTLGGKATDLFKPPYPTRRTLYGVVDRQDLPSPFRIFDFANPDLLIPQRNETTVPQQALFLLNHPFLLERARALAGLDEVAAAGEPEEKVRRLYRRAYQRDPSRAEVDAALALVSAAEDEPSLPRSPTADAWHYGFGRIDPATGRVADFQPLPHSTGQSRQGGPAWPDPTLGWVQLSPEGGHPGNDLAHAAVRRWVAPRDLTIRIRSRLVHEVEAGDGVRGTLASDRQGKIRSAEVHNDAVDVNVDALEVRAGEAIDFVVDIRGNLNSDQFLWAPTLEEVGPGAGTTWDARRDFAGNPPRRLGPWEQLAQVLLLSNEFHFVD